MKKSKIYFAHPVSIYNTEKEIQLISYIKRNFTYDLVNPNDPYHELKYKDKGMQHFIDLVDKCSHLIFYPFDDNTIGAGVNSEIMQAFKVPEKKVFYINPLTWKIQQIYSLKGFKKLSIESTRSKISKLKILRNA